MYYLDSVLPARRCFLPAVYTCLNGVALAQHSEATLTPRVIRMFECVYVYVVHGITTPSVMHPSP